MATGVKGVYYVPTHANEEGEEHQKACRKREEVELGPDTESEREVKCGRKVLFSETIRISEIFWIAAR